MTFAHPTSTGEAEGDCLTPAQLVPTRSIHSMQPEGRLALAVLEDAVATIRATAGVRSGRAQVLYAKALAWLTSDEQDHPFAFLNVCAHLGLDATWIRTGVLRRYYRTAPVRGDHRTRRNAGRYHAITLRDRQRSRAAVS